MKSARSVAPFFWKYDEKTDGEKGEFQIPFDSLEDTLKGLLNVFKEKKAAYIEAIEKEKEENGQG